MSTPSKGAWKQQAPGAWPGVCSTVRLDVAHREHLAVGEVAARWLRPGLVPEHPIVGVEAWLAPVAATTSSTALTWSLCPWVQTTATTRRSPTAAMMDAAPGRVDDEHLGVVPDEPDVVVDVPGATVELEDA